MAAIDIQDSGLELKNNNNFRLGVYFSSSFHFVTGGVYKKIVQKGGDQIAKDAQEIGVY
jgi:hypothetical protein